MIWVLEGVQDILSDIISFIEKVEAKVEDRVMILKLRRMYRGGKR